LSMTILSIRSRRSLKTRPSDEPAMLSSISLFE
jgi:hypothetical protein